jgi:hypothetical protein
MYSIKQGVSLHMTPELEKILEVICFVFRAYYIPVVITSAVDGPHREGSLHYKFRAVDIRKYFLTPEHMHIWEIHSGTILDALRINFVQRTYPVTVINEQDHLHIEWKEL